MVEFSVSTKSRSQFIDITGEVQSAVEKMKVSNGICLVFIPHTTAGVTINENADPDVIADIQSVLERAVPWDAGYRHGEGNAAAHAKASIMGSSVSVIIEAGRLRLGTWQGIFFCEFDGPRRRKVWVQAIASG
ncbi:MAG: YjbQ family protein [Candidatus Eremiobacteraeota bacterium]|nr:YjbQ family protein [Candidatus Eremiobacteraeota bacterium]